MLFNSFTFLIFMPIVFVGYWLLCFPRDGRSVSDFRLWLQNLFIVIVSYVFYGWWSWKFLLLIFFTSIWAWASGLIIAWNSNRHNQGGCCSAQSRRGEKLVVAVALVVNIGILCAFKYYDFFLDNAILFLSAFGVQAHSVSLKVVLPVGISFYTFQALSYVIDVYRGNIRPTRDVVAFLAFVSFFPQLVAGPIERATNLLPQFLSPRRFDYALAVEGCRQMLWGFFKKILVADTCAAAANAILGNAHPSSLSLWVGMICFAFQIYGDFSGYSDIAIGCAKLFGIRLMRNFNLPYFSRNIAEFWRRWHISLTTWFRDYLYIPLGGSRCGRWRKVRNTFAIFLVSGFWHGANWTFIAWGAFHAFCFLPSLLCGKNRKYVDVVAQGRMLPSATEVLQMIVTFFIAVVGWTLFRAPDISTACRWLVKMLLLNDLTVLHCRIGLAQDAILPVVILLLIEWLNRERDQIRVPTQRVVRWCVYYVMVLFILLNRVGSQAFIYFQF